LCAYVFLPLQTGAAAFNHISQLANALHPIAAALIAARTAPPLPSRGPPAV